jgi:hypothetical protein
MIRNFVERQLSIQHRDKPAKPEEHLIPIICHPTLREMRESNESSSKGVL